MGAINKPIRVLHLISSLQVGGAERLLLDLVKESSHSDNVQFVVVIMNDLVNEQLKKELIASGCTVYFLNRPESHRHPKYLLTLLQIIRKHRTQVIHCHTYGSKMWGILCKLIYPWLKLAFTIHDTRIIQKLSSFQVFLHKRLIDQNIAISNAVLQECTDRQVHNAVKIYNGIQVNRFQSLQRKKTALPDKIKNEIKVVNVARITHQKKGQDILIRAVKACKDRGFNVSCTFIGGYYEYDKESPDYLHQLIKELDLQNDVRFLGNRDDVNELLPDFDLFVLPSRNEGLGLVVLEAMAAGLPVIASNIDGPAELIQHGVNGYLFDNEDAADLADKIIEVTKNQSNLKQVVENATGYVRGFDISVMLKYYISMYVGLLTGASK